MSRIGGVPVRELVSACGTPLVVYDVDVMKAKLQEYRDHFVSDRFKTGVVYASKAFSCKAMIRIVDSFGFLVDVVSLGEMVTALLAGIDPSRIIFHGNNKSEEEIEYALEKKIGTIVCDNLMEAMMLEEKARYIDHPVHVLLRVNPGIEAHTHKYIVTGHIDSKFGISLLDESRLVHAIMILRENPNICFDGLHAHIGSQIFEKQAFVEEIRTLFSYMNKMKERYGITCNTLDLGGGFAARYTNEDAPIPLAEVCEAILTTAQEEEDKYQTGIERIWIEPGRSLCAEAGYNLYSIGFTKKTPNKTYLFVNGGMSDNIRPALYQAKYDAYIEGRENDAPEGTFTIAGKCCESGDILIESIDLPKAHYGDILVMKTTGAYGYAMASHYNKLPLPAVVFAESGKFRTVIRRESIEHMISLEEDEL